MHSGGDPDSWGDKYNRQLQLHLTAGRHQWPTSGRSLRWPDHGPVSCLAWPSLLPELHGRQQVLTPGLYGVLPSGGACAGGATPVISITGGTTNFCSGVYVLHGDNNQGEAFVINSNAVVNMAAPGALLPGGGNCPTTELGFSIPFGITIITTCSQQLRGRVHRRRHRKPDGDARRADHHGAGRYDPGRSAVLSGRQSPSRYRRPRATRQQRRCRRVRSQPQWCRLHSIDEITLRQPDLELLHGTDRGELRRRRDADYDSPMSSCGINTASASTLVLLE